MLFKSLEFKLASGQKVKITDIPVLEEDNKNRFMLQIRLQKFISIIQTQINPRSIYSFKDYLKKVLKWPDYEAIFGSSILKNNA
ncbi:MULTISPECIES: DUF2535 family protein [Bacillaceae]|uniref:DUF2535 family protein n=1 Tax=Metabacillus endolithicus TaxID=1535204 RepID=A0ABW5BWM8_9BACI|nr:MULTISPECIES: DUF2535 family protein [Bacillaceae]MCM3162989.1 YpmP family protein [Metabacillus litoralis]MCM3410695.1 YpmP family protein [Metabacillus litoralis]PGT83072.1 hypothetical protein COD11_13415 [Bacillus sp. AFS040349]UGB29151.1 YpmP family protein [Metabacillus sp. B2-18]UPG64221.1 YpmP family protein [Metabacillus endolithicus]